MIKCSVCGRFCKPADSSTSFISGDTIDPPEPDYYCASCVEREKQYFIKHRWLPPHYIHANWEFDVAKVIGFILIRLPRTAWDSWHDSIEPIPIGYEIVGN